MKFILTKELGKLAKWLRILGYDAEYFDKDNPGFLFIRALKDSRIILTRNHRLPKRTALRIVMIESEIVKEQIPEVLNTLKLKVNKDIMFTRCILCNEPLIPVEKESVRNIVPEYVFKTQESFITCPKCNRVYWQGTHWGNAASILEEIERKR